MKITSSSGGKKDSLSFDKIMFVHYQGKSYAEEQKETVVKQVSIKDNNHKIAQFFKEVSDFMKTKKMRDSESSDSEHYQFVLSSEDFPVFPVKWFTLWLNNGDVITHDIAFSVTYIKKNGMTVPFGRVIWKDYEMYPIYREINMKRNAFKYIANQIRKDSII